MSNKDRVYVCLYFRQGISNNPDLRQEYGLAAYHWSLLIQPKGSEGLGSTYDVKFTDAYGNLPGSGGWQYYYRSDADMRRSRAILCQIMIGKLEPGTSPDDVNELLRRIPIPVENTDPVQNCVTWLRYALRQLQQQGCAEDFDIDEFMAFALRLGDEKLGQDPGLRGQPFLQNYTSRKFP
jgi:hypothetical protein